MARLSEDQYGEYHALLVAWVEADRALQSAASADTEARDQAQRARDALDRFRERHGLDRAPARSSGLPQQPQWTPRTADGSRG